jgi:hypothetical protein
MPQTTSAPGLKRKGFFITKTELVRCDGATLEREEEVQTSGPALCQLRVNNLDFGASDGRSGLLRKRMLIRNWDRWTSDGRRIAPLPSCRSASPWLTSWPSGTPHPRSNR